MKTCSLILVLAAVAAVPPARAAGTPGRPVRTTRTGHVTNYDESKVGRYRLPDALVCTDGTPVRDARTWFGKRRPEILRAYETEIYGRIPETAPKVSGLLASLLFTLGYGRIPETAPKVRVETISSGQLVEGGAGVRSHVILHFGPARDGPKADLVLYRPLRTAKPPVLLQMVFFRGLPSGAPEPPLPARMARMVKKSGRKFSETGPVRTILDRGYAYATFKYSDVQPDRLDSQDAGVEALARGGAGLKRAPDEWGAITAWAWGASRVLDYLETDPDVDGSHVALIGHSRLGKTVLWASALDPRFAMGFSSCSGEMGAALARRDYGETIDDMAQNFPWQFAENFQKYAGHWDSMPVDAHLLIALSAPRPLFITGGTGDQWSDPHGEFLAEVAASPVYRLLGREGLEQKTLPPIDTALVKGSLGWRYHDGPHAILEGDWLTFLEFADLHLKGR